LIIELCNLLALLAEAAFRQRNPSQLEFGLPLRKQGSIGQLNS
jgi:hypothetical protein